MLPISQRIAFSLFAVLTLSLGARGFYRVYLRIAAGKGDTDKRTDHLLRRSWYAIKTTLSQQRVFRKRPVLSIFHSFIFYAFVLYLVVNFLDALEGFVQLRSAAPSSAIEIYRALADAFSVLAIFGVIIFVLRRFLFRSRRDFAFNPRTPLHPSVREGYIQRDSVIVSAFILFHIGSRVIGNAAKLATTGSDTAQPFSSYLAPVFAGPHALAWSIFGYWGALGSVLLFLVYFPYSKHIHLLMAPVKYFFRRAASTGELPAAHIDLEASELQAGAAKLADLAWPRLLDAYACIQCNRCQDVCPASQTGKALSPAALEINKRMVLNDITGQVNPFALSGESSFEAGLTSGPELLEVVISPEAAWACTTCGACMEVCPTENEQMLDIIDIRRNSVLLKGEFPSQLQSAFRGMERNGNPWAISREKRMDWAGTLNVPTIDKVADPDVLYWVGCAASYDSSAQKTARAVVQLLREANVKFAVLGKRESCTGDSARRAGNELLYQQLAATAVETLNAVRPKLVIASCPHCVNTISKEYPQIGGNYSVMHHTEYLDLMLREGKLVAAPADAAITFHDPCYLGRHRGSYDQPRAVLHVLTNEYVELPRSKRDGFCCGAGGAQFWKEEEQGTERVSENRFREVQRALEPSGNSKVLAVGCPFCKSMLQSTPSAADDSSIVVKDVAELLWEGVQRAKGTLQIDEAAADTYDTPLTEKLYAIAPQKTVIAVSACNSPLAGATVSEQTSASEQRKPAAETQNTMEAPVRKKWVPKATLGSVETPQQQVSEAVLPAQQTPPETADNAPQVPRKKWQPRDKG